MSRPLVIADEAALHAYLEDFADRVAGEAVDRAVAIAKVTGDLEECLTVRQAAEEISDGSEIDTERCADKIHRAITDRRLVNRAPSRDNVQPQRNGRRGRQPRTVRRGDLDLLWPGRRKNGVSK